jgi:type I restriction enzyme, S subunit
VTPAADGWREVSLGEICEFRYGKSLPEAARRVGPVPVFGSNGIVGHHDKAITTAPTIVVGRKGSFGEVCYSECACWPIDTTYYVDGTATNADLRWLSYRLAALGLNHMNRAAAVPGLNRDDAYRKRLLLPPLPEQRRIAAILDKAEELRAKRRTALKQLSGLTQSVFLEMFGDPATNPKGWPQRSLLDVVDGPYGVKAGPFGSSLKKEEYTNSGYRVYGQEQVLSGRFDVGDYYISERKYQALKSCAVREGDVLVSLVGSFGKVLVVPAGIEPGIINPRLLKITPQRDLLAPEFLASLLQQPSIQREFERVSHGGTMGILNAGLLKRLQVPLAPLCLQDAFIQAKNHVVRVRSYEWQSVQALDSLFSALQHQAFSGAL